MMNIIFRSSLFSIHSKYLLPSYKNCLTDLSPRYHSLSHPYIQQCKRRFFIVFFPDYFSTQNEKKFWWEWFFILLRMIFHLEPCEESGVVGSVQVRPAYNMKNAGIGSHLSDFFCFSHLWWTFLFGSLHLVFTVSLLSSSEGFDVQCVMVKEHEKAVSARVFYGLFLFYSMICTTFAHCMLWYA